MNSLSLFLLRLYKKAISPYLPPACRFTPTCSVYAMGCFEKYTFIKAFYLSLRRIMRCHPFHPGGDDPVP